jgi:hypothetical protein
MVGMRLSAAGGLFRKSVPQRLKPSSVAVLYGTAAEAVPFVEIC